MYGRDALSSHCLLPHFFFSNSQKVLVEKFHRDLIDPQSRALYHWVVLPTKQHRRWIKQYLLKNQEKRAFLGLEFFSARALLEKLFFHQEGYAAHFPNLDQLSLRLFSQLRQWKEGGEKWWDLVLCSSLIGQTLKRSDKKMVLFSLSQQIASLFLTYFYHGDDREILSWKESAQPDKRWQYALWSQCIKHASWIPPFYQPAAPPFPTQFYFFGFTHLPKILLEALFSLSRKEKSFWYLLSPCELFWSDLSSQREEIVIKGKLQEKESSPSLWESWKEHFSCQPSLLANLSSIWRKQMLFFEEREGVCEEHYLPPKGNSLLSQLQQSFLSLSSFPLKEGKDQTITCHQLPSPSAEVIFLREKIFREWIPQKKLTSWEDLMILLPDPALYLPLLRSILGAQIPLFVSLESPPPLDSSSYFHALFHLLSLIGSRWEREEVSQLLQHPALYSHFSLSAEEVEIWMDWIGRAHIEWGYDLSDRRRFFSSSVEGTWKWGLDAILRTLWMGEESHFSHAPICASTEAHLLGTLLHLLSSLRRDLSLFEKGENFLPWREQISHLHALSSTYLHPQDREEREKVEQFWQELYRYDRFLQIRETPHSWEVTLSWIFSLLSSHSAFFKEEEGMIVASFQPNQLLPKKIICILGLNQEQVPRRSLHVPLNLLRSPLPQRGELDRHTFLEALSCAEERIFLSYSSSSTEQAPSPSPLVQELFAFLNGQKDSACSSLFWQMHHTPYSSHKKISGKKKSYPSPFPLSPSSNSLSFKDLEESARSPLHYFFKKALHSSHFLREGRERGVESLFHLHSAFLPSSQMLTMLKNDSPPPLPDLSSPFAHFMQERWREERDELARDVLAEEKLSIFSLEWNYTCPRETTFLDRHYIFPAPLFSLPSVKQKLSLIGYFPLCTPCRLYFYAHNDSNSLLKLWPLILFFYSSLPTLCPSPFSEYPSLFFLKSGVELSLTSPPEQDFWNKNWFAYLRYLLLLERFSPLFLSRWIPLLVRGNREELKKEKEKSTLLPPRNSEEALWLHCFAERESKMPSVEELFSQWQQPLIEAFSALYSLPWTKKILKKSK